MGLFDRDERIENFGHRPAPRVLDDWTAATAAWADELERRPDVVAGELAGPARAVEGITPFGVLWDLQDPEGWGDGPSAGGVWRHAVEDLPSAPPIVTFSTTGRHHEDLDVLVPGDMAISELIAALRAGQIRVRPRNMVPQR